MTVRNKTIASSLIAATLFFSCGENTTATVNYTVDLTDTTEQTPVKEDSLITKIRPVLFDYENQELSFNGHKPFDLTISDIRYSFISLKEYYSEQEQSLAAQAKYSTNKDKTGKALRYLNNMSNSAGADPQVYKVEFHLKAKVDKTVYDEQKILYLKKDLTRLELIFP